MPSCFAACSLIAAVLAVMCGVLYSVDLTVDPSVASSMPKLGSGAMFDAIAERYDITNKALSLGFDKAWRQELIQALELSPESKVLDLATGTAEVAMNIAQHAAKPTVIGVDPSPKMLGIGREKVAAAGLSSHVTLNEGDAQRLEGYDDDSFDVASMSFGIRNVPDRVAALREIGRVVKKDGRVAVLEFSEPNEGLLAPIAKFFVAHVVPRLGALMSGGARAEYAHLQESIRNFPSSAGFRSEMEQAGLKNVSSRLVHSGGVYLYTASAP